MDRKPPIKVTAAIIMNNGKLFIARRPAGDKLAGKWEFPGGKIENDETAEACLAREIKEEFDIDVEVAEFLGSSVYHYPDISVELLAFRTTLVSGTITMKAHEDCQWVSLQDLDQYDFAPADVPFVKKLCSGSFRLSYPGSASGSWAHPS
jgi:8-oxo-dGTP diphosphatase